MKTPLRIGSVILISLLSLAAAPQLAVAEDGARACHVRPLAKSPAPRWKRTCWEHAQHKVPIELAHAGGKAKAASAAGGAQ